MTQKKFLMVKQLLKTGFKTSQIKYVVGICPSSISNCRRLPTWQSYLDYKEMVRERGKARKATDQIEKKAMGISSETLDEVRADQDSIHTIQSDLCVNGKSLTCTDHGLDFRIACGECQMKFSMFRKIVAEDMARKERRTND